MTEIAVKRDPALIGSEVRLLCRQARQINLAIGVEIGRRLVEAKEMLPYGQWGEWLERETEFSQTTATRWIKLFEEYGAAQIGIFGAEVDSPTLQNLSVSNALRLLAVPAEEREEFAIEHDVEHMSARELDRLIKEREEAEKKLREREELISELRDNLAAAREDVETLGAKVEELESRPVEVAVQAADPQEIERAAKEASEKAAAEAKAKYDKELEALKKRLDGAEKKRNELEMKVHQAEEKAQKAAEEAEKRAGANVGELKKEAERAKAEAEALRKQLAMADSVTPAFKVYYEAAQVNLAGAIELLGKAEGDLKKNLVSALRALLETFGAMIDELR